MIESTQIEIGDALALEEDDLRRGPLEIRLQAMDLVELRALWQRTRAAAAEARRAGDMARVILLVRGSKTIQRIADARGEVFAVRRRV